ncbi:cysteine desulfurase family protein [Youngiibacter multivorans]|uniref:Cysteine desulfurase n=1 Tax=Youngiibacter multivorans TaxID=937251 RepID=A0ABS4G3T3_9CLOT|nr:cysteine desulfurase family protein [Youngiibacter multivorans]MBP1919196.1 cysteine desulfurase [Youngiibacter multivorans]
MEAYLDNAATTRPSKAVIEKVCSSLGEIWGNTSSLHRVGMAADDAVSEARTIIASAIGAQKEEIIFNASASEGNNQVIKSFIREGAHFITTSTEHPSVMRSMEYAERSGVEVTRLKSDRYGNLDLDEFRASLRKNTSLVSAMMVNNETGAINPINEMASAIKESGSRARLHVDAVQGLMKLPIDVRKSGIDFLTASAHKVHGPKGVGMLYVRKGLKLESLVHGGSHEMGMRAGTLNVSGILGFAESIREMSPNINEHYNRAYQLKKRLYEGLTQVDGIIVNSPLEYTSPYILSISAPFLRGEILLRYLSEKGVCVSTGSACSSNSTKDSHVLSAMGLSQKEIKGSVRLSLSPMTSDDEIAYALETLKEACSFLRRK